MILTIENHGPLIVSCNYWDSEVERAGKIYCSTNAGAVRVLLPRQMRSLLTTLRQAEYAILSRGVWPAMGLPVGVEILWEDHTDSPYCWHLSPETFDMLPAEPEPGREWVISVWDCKKGKPHKALERRLLWRRVPRIPWARPWSEQG